MSEYILSCCSTADLTKEHFERRNIEYVCFHFALDGIEYIDDLGETIPFEDFYARMSAGAETRTSQVNISEYVEHFDRFAREGKDIVHVCLSSGISGTINSARNAALIIKERYPQCNIYIVDSLGASSGFGLLMDAMSDMRDAGLTAQELVDWAETTSSISTTGFSPQTSPPMSGADAFPKLRQFSAGFWKSARCLIWTTPAGSSPGQRCGQRKRSLRRLWPVWSSTLRMGLNTAASVISPSQPVWRTPQRWLRS